MALFPSICSSLQKTNDIRYLYKKNPILATTSWRSSASGADDGFVSNQHWFFPSKNERHKVPLQGESYSGTHILAIVLSSNQHWFFPSKNERHKVPLQGESYSGTHILATILSSNQQWFFPSKNERHKVPLQEEFYSGTHILALVLSSNQPWFFPSKTNDIRSPDCSYCIDQHNVGANAATASVALLAWLARLG